MNIFKKPECHIIFNENKHHHRHKLKDKNNNSVRYPTFFSDDDISGKFELIKTSTNFDYSLINVELIGLIDNYKDPKSSVRFLSLSKEISKNSSLTKDNTSYNFSFKKVKLPYESYKGESIGVKYSIRVNIFKMMRTISYEEEFAVVRPSEESVLKKNDEPITMNVGIKELLSVLIEFDHSNYGIHGTLKGFVSFGKVNLLLTKMEVNLIKKETVYGIDSQKNSVQKIITSFELIDGGPYKNETIPFRFFLAPYNLTPSYIDIAGNFSVRYYLNLIIKDQNNNRYFKQKEIFLHRLLLDNSNNLYNTLNSNSVNNKSNSIEHLKDFITEPIDYGDYFSVFNDIDEDKEYSKYKIEIKEPEPDDFYFRSTLTGYNIDKDDINEEESNTFKKNLRNYRSNTQYDIRKNYLPSINERKTNKEVINEMSSETKKYMESIKKYKEIKEKYEDKLEKMEKEKEEKKQKENKKKDKKKEVVNVKEKNKYKNNDILISDNYYNTDNYIIYENSYQNVFDDKLKKNRIKYSNLTEKNKIDDDEDEKEKEYSTSINDDNTDNSANNPIINSINDYNLYYPNEPFSNTLIMNNFPSNYNNSGSGDFRQNLMGGRIKKK